MLKIAFNSVEILQTSKNAFNEFSDDLSRILWVQSRLPNGALFRGKNPNAFLEKLSLSDKLDLIRPDTIKSICAALKCGNIFSALEITTLAFRCKVLTLHDISRLLTVLSPSNCAEFSEELSNYCDVEYTQIGYFQYLNECKYLATDFNKRFILNPYYCEWRISEIGLIAKYLEAKN